MFLGNFINTIRISFGDFTLFNAIEYMTTEDVWIFYFAWFLTFLISNIVFLNFIVAEASASYTNVNM